MILTVDKESKKLVATIEEKGGDQKYKCVVSACENPVCTCGNVYMELIPMPAEEQNGIHTAHRNVEINLDKKKLNFRDKKSVSKEDKKFAKKFVSKLDDKDFKTLNDFYLTYKNELTEKASPASIDAYFNFHKIEDNGLKSSYNNVLPYGDQLIVTIEGAQCMIFDHYCLLPKCTCSDTNLDVISIDKFGKFKKNLLSAAINYKNKKWNVLNESSTSADSKEVIEDIKRQVPDLYEQMHKRHKKLKAIYAYCRKKHFASDEKIQLPKIGRNEPCPCGSGKKYKKCCLSK